MRTRWLYVPHRAPAVPVSDLLLVRCPSGEEYHCRVLSLFGKFCREDELTPFMRLVAFLRPFDRCYSVAGRSRWCENVAKERQLRWRPVV